MPKLRSKVKRLTNRLKRKNIGTRQTRVRNTRTKKTRVRVTRDRNSRARNTRARKTKIRSKKLRKTIIKKRNRKMLSKHKRGGVIPSRVMNSLNSLNFTTKTRGLYSKSGKELANFIVDYLKLTEEETRNMTVGELKKLFSEKVLYTSINKGNFIEKPDEVFVDYSNLPSDETKLSDIDSVADRLYENKKKKAVDDIIIQSIKQSETEVVTQKDIDSKIKEWTDAQRLYENKKKKAKDDIIKQLIKQSTTGVVTQKEIDTKMEEWIDAQRLYEEQRKKEKEYLEAFLKYGEPDPGKSTTESNPGPSEALRTASKPVSELQSPESSADEEQRKIEESINEFLEYGEPDPGKFTRLKIN